MLRRLAQDMLPGGMSVIMLDLARLRTVNEVLGYDTGDTLLVQIAERLRAATASPVPGGPAPVLARLSGGVFAVLCLERDRAAVECLRRQVDEALTAPMVCGGHAVDIQLVYGIAECRGDAALSVEDLLRRADHALGEAKRLRRGWVWHVPEDDTARARQLSLLSSLRSAAASGELEMWLQPKQCLQSGQVVGMEGLVRWRHPERGYVSPAEFIPFAERAGHIGVVTEFMLAAALRVLAGWRTSQPQLSIAVNISALDIQDLGFAARVEQIARHWQAPLQNLRLEITESSLMEDADRALPVLQALRELGVQLSIDDFGTGYSSLAYLKRLPVNELKIDRSFVADADGQSEAQALLRTIVNLGHSLNMTVTAEGVERPQELALLREIGCDLAQGYLISRPMDPQAAARYVAALPATALPASEAGADRSRVPALA
ncbi:MAG: bifunctional diguanylate cyclase/phosphodiesterase [Rubrivivax sp.]|nr:bifunctional diguanylate cyclase/phosphodiesterase [Rubrivivax sp.]